MAVVTKSTKQGGTTDLQSGQSAVVADVNTDMNTLFNLVNGNIDNDNIKASAGIVYSKLSLASSITSSDLVDGTIVNGDVNASADITLTKLADYSASATEVATATDPGVSNSESLATTLTGEIERLRYAIERQALGIDAARFDATGTIESTYWGDLPARDLRWLPGFNGIVTSGLPSGWTNVNTATLAQEAADAADKTAGKGRAIKITAAGSANEGISYTLSGLKASTRYFFAAIVKATSGDTVRFVVTGGDATSSFRDFTNTSTSTSWTILRGVVQTDSTPTNLVVKVDTGADTDIVWVAGVAYGECSASPAAFPRVAVVEQRVATTAGTAITGGITDSGLDTNYQFVDDGTLDLDLTVYVPGDGYYIKVTADWTIRETTSESGSQNKLNTRLYQSVNGAAMAGVRDGVQTAAHSGAEKKSFVGSLTWIVKNPNPGQSYRYALAATKSGGTATMTPQEGNEGSSSLTIQVLPY